MFVFAGAAGLSEADSERINSRFQSIDLRIATDEKLDVTPEDLETEIHMMAMQRGENPRRVRARLEKQQLMENLAAQILERKAIDIVLDSATYADEPAPSDADTMSTSTEGVPIEVCRKSAAGAAVSAE